ncbi:NAD(P)H-dependent oxidoreductase [Bengtsoniella intestinalis]|uniref:NAD(P)H-dependent oxidoreductase n=1 Tax=Bengtsoniella intestinalis TaxID=3073143 RepID=UPI00391F47FF
MEQLTIITVGTPNPRLEKLLSYWGENRLTALPNSFQNQRLLLAVSLDKIGLCDGLHSLLSTLRKCTDCLEGSVAGIVVDGANALYTKSVAREIVFAANCAGCTFVGRSLVEGVATLDNFTVQASNGDCSLLEAYEKAVSDLIARIVTFAPPRQETPHLLTLHASTYGPSNTMDLWSLVQHQLPTQWTVQEVGLRNGAVSDCAGCPYTTCLHFGEEGRCFYGGVMVDDVYPALRQAQAVMLLCPNYNDALSANLTACINRLTALYRTTDFTHKAVYALVVSGYSGGDIVAKQVISALSMNKGFYLPSRFCRMELAQQPSEALALTGIKERMVDFGEQITYELDGRTQLRNMIMTKKNPIA